jgi:hypothetical protein
MYLKFGCVEHIASSGLSMAVGTIVRSFLHRPYDRPRLAHPSAHDDLAD